MKKVQIFFLVLLLCGIFSCKKNQADPNPNPGPGPTPPANYPVVGDEATDFEEMNSQGLLFRLSALKGKVILLSFSTMWCGPCKEEAGHLEALYQEYKDRGFEVVQCLYQDENSNPADLEDLARWISTYGLTFTVVNDPDRSTVNTYKPEYIPLNIIIDRNFILRMREYGFSLSQVKSLIEQYL